MKRALFFITAFCGFIFTAQAGMPKVITDALDAYKKEGAQQLFVKLLKNSPLENDKGAMAQVANIAQLEAYCGKFDEYELVGEYNFGHRVRRFYLINHASN